MLLIPETAQQSLDDSQACLFLRRGWFGIWNKRLCLCSCVLGELQQSFKTMWSAQREQREFWLLNSCLTLSPSFPSFPPSSSFPLSLPATLTPSIPFFPSFLLLPSLLWFILLSSMCFFPLSHFPLLKTQDLIYAKCML